ncbi:cytochrome P450 86B1-like [Nymphaea colorata]|nr:cytochrome P450 86B1-like [Nymphaea colorata]
MESFLSFWCLSSLRWPEICLSLMIFFSIHHFISQRNKPTKPWPFLGMLPQLLGNVHRLYDWSTYMLKTYGGTSTFHGPSLTNMNFISTCDPRNTEYILKVNFDNFPKGDEFCSIFSDLMGNGIFNSDSESWKKQRRMANSLVHSKAFRGFMARTTQHIVRHQLVPVLSSLARSSSSFDMQDVLLRFTFDSTCTAIFGESVNSLSKELASVPFAKAMNDAMESIMYRYVVPKSWWHLLRLLNIGKERQLANALAVINNFVSQQLKMKMKIKGCSAGMDLLSAYASVSDDEDFLRDTAVNFLVAGRDTSGAALSWFFWLLSRNPDVEKKILEEQRMILAETQRGRFDIEDLSKMVYLHASICETLRLYPVVPMGQKGVVKEDVLPSGTVVKPGTIILYNIYAMGRMEWIWGKDCLEFKPERWVDDQGRLRYENSGFRFLAFNGGPRTCVGKDMALVQMKYAAAEILLNFEIDVVEGHHVSPKPSVIMTMKNGLMVKAKEKPKRCMVSK